MTLPVYYAEYKPVDSAKFTEMADEFMKCETEDAARLRMMLYLFDLSYDRQDLLVAMTRMEKTKGWKLS